MAADLLSQAEHDELASAILVTTSEELAEEVSREVDGFVKELSRGEIIQKSLDNYGHILIAETLDDAIDAANEIASEHLEIVTKDAFTVMTKIRNAGAIFIGEYSSEPLGDYFAGPNHVLPTNGTAKFFSPLSVDDFLKKSSIILTQKKHWKPYIRTSSSLQKQNSSRHMQTPSMSALKRGIKNEAARSNNRTKNKRDGHFSDDQSGWNRGK